MSTCSVIVVATAGCASVSATTARHGVVAAPSSGDGAHAAVPARALVACQLGVDAAAPLPLATALRELDDRARGFVARDLARVRGARCPRPAPAAVATPGVAP